MWLPGSCCRGDRLPAHCDLAFRLQLSVGTVARAYIEAERRGLVFGHVGRGTFVRSADSPEAQFFGAGATEHDRIDLTVSELPPHDDNPTTADLPRELGLPAAARIMARTQRRRRRGGRLTRESWRSGTALCVVRDYGMFDRREAAQYYPEVQR